MQETTVAALHAVKLGTFTETNIPFGGPPGKVSKLFACSTKDGQRLIDRLSHLKGTLEGPAATILWEAQRPIEAEPLRVLRSRFGTQEQAEAFRHQLRSRRRKPGESLQRCIAMFAILLLSPTRLRRAP